MSKKTREDLQAALETRFDDAPEVQPDAPVSETLHGMANRGSCRAFTSDPVPPHMLEMLCAVALSSPTKSDLQQRDIIVLQDPDKRERVADLVSGQAWVADAPMILIFCGNNRRQRLLHDWKDVPFANHHLDAFFNAVGDAAIALGAFVTAAESVGLGCCPISAVRNDAAAVSALLELPAHVFPFAGLAVGYPKHKPSLSKRLPLAATCHVDRYAEAGLEEAIASYDASRASAQPYRTQRLTDNFGTADTYTWSEDKVRQYSQPERDAFGDYVRAQGFKLD